MVIEIEGCNFRINGNGTDWQIEYPYVDKKNGGTRWKGKFFFPSLRWTLDKAYELALQENAETVDVKNAAKAFERVKKAMVAAVEKAVG